MQFSRLDLRLHASSCRTLVLETYAFDVYAHSLLSIEKIGLCCNFCTSTTTFDQRPNQASHADNLGTLDPRPAVNDLAGPQVPHLAGSFDSIFSFQAQP
jgi:hypothetical protein